jgi:vacuolar-type H+-ATPase subunit F/Vma7
MAERETRGIPMVEGATVEVIEGAKAQARLLGADPALVFIPHPGQDRSDAELRQLADDHVEAIVKFLVR